MGEEPLWIFGYGSLMWNPGFPHSETAIARLQNYTRSFCMRSIHHRGTVANPGLVLALDPLQGGYCDGLALQVSSGAQVQTLEYLRERELISSAYLEKTLEIQLTDGRTVRAVTYVIDTEHDQYCSGLSLQEQADIIARSTGGRGPNSEYLHSTSRQLANLGINDTDLEWLSDKVQKITPHNS
ncbi:MAG: gamma-glutamylcyclotransferase [Paracoccaceae bacterium]